MEGITYNRENITNLVRRKKVDTSSFVRQLPLVECVCMCLSDCWKSVQSINWVCSGLIMSINSISFIQFTQILYIFIWHENSLPLSLFFPLSPSVPCSVTWPSPAPTPTPSPSSSTPRPSCSCRVRVTVTLCLSVCHSEPGTQMGCWCSRPWLTAGWRCHWWRARSPCTWMWHRGRTHGLASHQVGWSRISWFWSGIWFKFSFLSYFLFRFFT